MDLEQLRKKWKSIDIENDNLTKENNRLKKRLVRNKAISISDRLQRRVKNMALLSLITPFIIVLSNRDAHIFEIPTLWVAGIYLYFLGALQIYFVHCLRKTDILRLSLVDAMHQVAHRMILMRRIKFIEVILGCVPVFMMFRDLILSGNYGITIAAGLGGLIGGIIGIRISITNMRLLKGIQTTLKEVEGENNHI